MARIKKNRIVQMTPHFSGFRPMGLVNESKSVVIISFEEYEALKLCDYEHLKQVEAAKLMNISRPTFTRIYENVRNKIARAFVEGSSITFEGGSAHITEWYKCESCEIISTRGRNEGQKCPFCQNTMIILNTPEL